MSDDFSGLVLSSMQRVLQTTLGLKGVRIQSQETDKGYQRRCLVSKSFSIPHAPTLAASRSLRADEFFINISLLSPSGIVFTTDAGL